MGAIIISQMYDRKNLEKKGEEELKDARSYGLSEQEMAGTVVSLPTISFADRMTIDLGDELVELIYVGASHTDGSALVYLPRRKVLFAGDVLFTDFHPFMGDSNIQGWVETLDYILFLDANSIIPGHGPLSGKKDVAALRDYLLAFDTKAREQVAKTKDVEIIAAELKKVLPARSQGEWLIPYNVRTKYLQEKLPQ
jgi:glyoxylase-like metal-dependent hydrolase (beta-lactamase superfamily II)